MVPPMALRPEELAAAARTLDEGLLHARECARLTERHPELALDDAYRIQAQGISLRLARGETLRGYKMGLTSQAKREQMGLHSPVYGVLTDRMEVREGTYRLQGQIHPKIEPEVAFFLKSGLQGKITVEQALEACSGVCAAMEILDSRYVGFKYFSLPDVVADNSSSSHYLLGRTVRDPRELDLASLEMVMSVDGKPVERALSSAISGHPLLSLVQLCELLEANGMDGVPAGSVVLAGAATTAVQLAAGQTIQLQVQGLGEVSVKVEA